MNTNCLQLLYGIYVRLQSNVTWLNEAKTYMKQNSRRCLQITFVLLALMEQFLFKLLISIFTHRTSSTSGERLHAEGQVIPKLFAHIIHIELCLWF